MTDIASRIDVLSPKAGDTIAVSVDRILTAGQRENIHATLNARLPEGVKVMILEGGMALTHIESPAAAKERYELLCEIKALREEMRREREALGYVAGYPMLLDVPG